MSDRDDAAPARTKQKSQRSKTEGWRQDLKRRFREHITMNWVLDFEIPKEEQQFDFHYVAYVEDFVIYYCILTKRGSDEKDKVWLLWNGDEVYSTRDEEGLIVYFVSEMYERIRRMRWNFITSPVLVSGTRLR
jgi:hypothetical protein